MINFLVLSLTATFLVLGIWTGIEDRGRPAADVEQFTVNDSTGTRWSDGLPTLTEEEINNEIEKIKGGKK